jgi:hypothetical protein
MMLRALAMPTVGGSGLVWLHFRRLDFLDTFLSRKKYRKKKVG